MKVKSKLDTVNKILAVILVITFIALILVVSLYKGAPQISIISINNTPTHTAVENASVNANIYTFGNDILVETEAGNAIEVYNVQGQLLLNTVAKDGINTISGLNAGVVIVRVNGVSYTRYYYYENEKLMFAYLEGTDAHRLYFYNEKLFRWRYSRNAVKFSEADNHDNEDSPDFRKWQDFALNEAYQYK